MSDLTCLFRPRSTAVIGASRRRGTIAGEVFHDLVTRGFPGAVATDAREMIGSLRGSRLLDGFRGAPACDRDALVDVLLRVSRLVADCPEVAELELNPLFALSTGRGSIVVDARLRLHPAARGDAAPQSE